MKHTLPFILLFVSLTLTVGAQSKVKASEIIKQINAGQNVIYSNVEIEGTLDLTDLANRKEERSASSWLGNFSDHNDTFESTVEVSLSFTNCTFLGDVLAYYHLERREETFIAHFERDAVFKNCIFKNASEFKYSEFEGVAVFTGSTFNQVANFKYAEFSNGPSFASVKFDDGADFKYTEFPRETSFQKATFYGLANFKYSKFRSPLHIENVAFKGGEDFKYTRVDGQSFTSFLLENQ
jgi:pentapeptide repeat protein